MPATTEPQRVAERSRGRSWWPPVIGVLVSLLLLWWAARGLEVGAVVGQLGELDPRPVGAVVLVATLTFPMRMLRWRFLLRLSDGRPVGLGPAWHGIALGYMSNNLLPFRAGEVVRSYAASRLARIPFATTLASVAVERVFDTMTVVGTLVVILLLGTLPEGATVGGLPVDRLAQRVAMIGLLALGAAGAVLAAPSFFRALIQRLIPFPTVAGHLVRLLDSIRAGIAALRSPRLLLAVVSWSVVIWVINAISFQLLFPAFGISLGLSEALLVQAAIVFAIAVPSSPGFVGVFEAAIVASLGLYGVPQEQAFAYAITYHVTTFLPITLLGLYSLTRTSLRWRDLRGRREEGEEMGRSAST